MQRAEAEEGAAAAAAAGNGDDADGAEGFAARMRSAAVAKRKAMDPAPPVCPKRTASYHCREFLDRRVSLMLHMTLLTP